MNLTPEAHLRLRVDQAARRPQIAVARTRKRPNATVRVANGLLERVVVADKMMMTRLPKGLAISLLILIEVIMTRCTSDTVQIGENTFVHHGIVYRIIDNQITELGSLSSDSIPRSEVLNPTLRHYDNRNIDHIKTGAYAELTAVYRGDVLYFNLNLEGLNDLRDKFRGGSININFTDEFGFQINSVEVEMGELIRIVGSANETLRYEFNGRVQMSREMYRSIFTYSISSSLVKKGALDF